MSQQFVVLHHDARLPLQPRRGHRKSRNGCLGCKRRKVKCDELWPTCANCRRFDLLCQAAPASGVDRSAVPPTLPFAHGRGPGRPRRSWATAVTPCLRDPDPDLASGLNTTYAELLHHFTTCTGSSLAEDDSPRNPIALFWTRNMPQLGQSSPFVLHLANALAGRHLIYLRLDKGRRRPRQAAFEASDASSSRDLALTQQCTTMGLVELNKQIPNLDSTNCASIYIASMLLCLYTFAAGPTDPDDLLVCDAGVGSSGRWLSLVSGVRLIRTLFDPNLLFSGLLKPLGPSNSSARDPRPTCVCENFERIDWHAPLASLYKFITSNYAYQHSQVYLESFDTIAAIYDATYGNEHGLYSAHEANKNILLWLYSMKPSFVDLLRARDPFALLLLAYYVPLIKTMKRAWFMSAWPDHLLSTIQSILGPSYSQWLEWPLQVTKLMEQSDREST